MNVRVRKYGAKMRTAVANVISQRQLPALDMHKTSCLSKAIMDWEGLMGSYSSILLSVAMVTL